MIVHLNGWPGVGKKTVGEALAKRLGARFIHNHLLHDVAIVCAGLESNDRWTAYEKVRAAAYEALARRPATEPFVMTNALCKGAAREQAAWKHVVELAMARQVPLVPVVLSVAPDENVRRLQSEERVGRKMTDAAALKSFFAIDSIQVPDVPETLVLDVTSLSAEQAAGSIADHLSTLRDRLQNATTGHLQLR